MILWLSREGCERHIEKIADFARRQPEYQN